MRLAFTGLMMAALAGAAYAVEIKSAYTKIETDKNCAVFSAPQEDDPGDWLNLVCSGWRGYPVIVHYGDARESVFYGFPPEGELEWESFSGFNSTGPTVEWRIMSDGDRKWPFATIHRWFVDDGEGDGDNIEVLVVEKVGQVSAREGCVVGYVVATGNENANEKARRIADGQAFDFACGADQPVVDAGDLMLPMTTGGDGGG
ncbi:hypothetical protein AB2N04_03540 [Nitratireductor sp. GISD-1A_MAKvit]|uniref:hypothetical protein n=1 Tax=Nitratireductor sp. GISD-1A_MAKvit TaxID=3234198 RepID=UPI0034674B53